MFARPIKMLLAVCLTYLVTAIACVENEFLLLRSKSLNTIPQMQIIDNKTYTVMDVAKGDQLIDYSIDIKRTNLTSTPDGMGSLLVEDIISIESFFAGKIEKVKLTSVLTKKSFSIVNMFLTSSGKSSSANYVLNLSNQTIFKDLLCNNNSYYCSFYGQNHLAIGVTEGIVLNIKRELMMSPYSVSNFVCILHVRYNDKNIQEIGLPSVHIDEELQQSMPEGESCESLTWRLVHSKLPTLYAFRYCPVGGSTPKLNCIHMVKININNTNKTTAVDFSLKPMCTYSLSSSSGTMLANFSVVEMFLSKPKLIVANTDRIIWMDLEKLEEQGDATKTTEPMVFRSIYSQPLERIFCNSVNTYELCCTLILQTPSRFNNEFYRIIDIISFEGNLVSGAIGLQPMINVTHRPGYTLQHSLHTKNFVIFRYSDMITMCPRAHSGPLFKLDEERICINFTLEGVPMSQIKIMQALLYEENHSNPIDGYIVVAIKKDNANRFRIDPVLITGAYYTFMLDLNLEPYVCHRYFEHCGQTKLEFREPGKSMEVYDVPVYIVGDYFTSVLKRSSKRELDSLSNNGKLLFHYPSFFFGDMQKVEVIRPTDTLGSSNYISTENTNHHEYFAKPSTPYTYLLGKFVNFNTLIEPQTPYTVSLDWATFRMDRDNTIWIGIGATTLHFLNNEPREISWAFFTRRALESRQENIDFKASVSNFRFKINSNSAIWSNVGLPFESTDKERNYILHIVQLPSFIQTRQNHLQLSFETAGSSSSIYKRDLSFILEEGETFKYFRVPLDRERDLAAIITDKAFWILRVLAEDDTPDIRVLIKIRWTDMLMDQIDSIAALKDVLLVENTLILDVNVTLRGDPIPRTKIYLMNLDIQQQLIYTYGYISVEAGVSPDGYKLYYSKSTDKAVLIYYEKKTLLEYSLDNLFLDPTKLGRELQHDTKTVLDSYGKHSFRKLVPDSKNSTKQRGKTLALPFNGMYIIVAELNSLPDMFGNIPLMILIGEIGEVPLSVFRSSIVAVPQDYAMMLPDIVSDTRDLDVLPIYIIGLESKSVEVHFIWQKGNIALNYDHLIAEGENVTRAIDLELTFEDPTGTKYQELFKINRDPRFNIEVDDIKTLINFDSSLELKIDEYGLISSIGLECNTSSTGSTDFFVRNRTRYFNCKDDLYSVKLQLPVNKDYKLGTPSINLALVPKDLVEVQLTSEDTEFLNTFVMIESFRILVFKSVGQSLQSLLDSFYNSNEHFVIRQARFTDSHLEVYIIGRLGGNIKELLYTFPKEELRQSLISKVTIPYRLEFSANFTLNDKVKKNLMQRKNYVKTVDNLVFSRAELNLFSFGKKTLVELYLQSDDPNQARMTLVNSTITNKQDNSEVLAFEVLPHYLNDTPHDMNKYYKFVQLTVNSQQSKIQIARSLVTFTSATQVEYRISTTDTDLILSNIFHDFDGKQVLDGEIIAGNITKVIYNNMIKYMQTYHVFIACEDYLYETVVNEYFNYSSSFINYKINANLLMRYNFAGLCESTSRFRIQARSRHLLLHCIPRTESSIQSLIIYKWNPRENHSKAVNPLHILNETSGYSEAISLEYLFEDEFGTVKVLKSSPRNLIEQYTVFDSARLIFSVEKRTYAEKKVFLYLSNNYESRKLNITFNHERWLYMHIMLSPQSEDLFFYIVVCTLLASLLLLYNAKSLANLRRKLKRMFSFYRRTDRIIMREEAINQLEREEKEISVKLLSDVYF